MAKIRVGSARIDERGKSSGGKAGDQSGREVMIQDWYDRTTNPWVVLRAKSAEHREKIALCMEMACANANIGYDQHQRETLYTAAKPHGFDVSKVKTPAETDCSALVRVCCAYAGIIVGNFRTTNQSAILMATGLFERYTDKTYVHSSSMLMRGDILVTKSQGHTVVVLDDGPKAVPPVNYELGDRILKRGMNGADIRELQIILIGWSYDLGSYGADGDFGAKTQSAVSSFQRANDLDADGIYGPLSHAELVKLLALEIEQPIDDNEGVEDETMDDIESPPDNAGDADEAPSDVDPEPNGDEDPVKDLDRLVKVIGGTVNVRTQPNTSGKIVFVAKKGDMLAFSGMESLEGWYGVVCEGELCWISGKYSEIVEDATPEINPEPLPTENDPRAIIDISVYQTISDVNLMSKNVKLVIHRASIGLKKDTKWDKHAKLMQGAGILFGAYHYVKATNATEAVQEARVFYASASLHNPIFYCADMEWTGIAKGRARNICSAFIAELKRLGARKTGIYVGHHIYKLWNLNYDEVDFVWIPRYGDKATNLAGKPGKWPAYPCSLHQYSSGGKIPGIAGRIDMNRIVSSGIGFEELIKR